jgi:O-antigen ligase
MTTSRQTAIRRLAPGPAQRGGLRSDGTPHLAPVTTRVETRGGAPAFSASIRADAVVLAAGLYCLVAVSHIQVLVPPLGPLRLGISAVALSIGLLALDGSTARRLKWLGDRTSLAAIAMLVWMVVTIPTALSASVAFKAAIEDFTKVVLFYAVTVLAIRDHKDVERLTLTYALGATAYCAYVIATSSMAGARVAAVTKSYDPNDFAAYVTASIPVVVYVIGVKRSAVVRLGALVSLAILMYGLVLSGSRGGMVGLTVAMVLVIASFDAVRLTTKVAIAIVGVATVLAVANDEWYARMGTLFDAGNDYNVTAESGRTQTWMRGLGYFAGRPVTGVGAENFPVAEGVLNPLVAKERYGFGVQRLAAHNSFVQVLVELGLPGFIAFIAMITGAYRALNNGIRRQRDTNVRSLGQALRASLSGMLVASFFLSHAYAAMLFATFALCVGYGKASRLNPAEPLAR